MGIFQIVAAIRMRKAMEGEWVLALSGVLSIIFCVLIVCNPGAGALAVIWGNRVVRDHLRCPADRARRSADSGRNRLGPLCVRLDATGRGT
jgi:hypothetical protein